MLQKLKGIRNKILSNNRQKKQEHHYQNLIGRFIIDNEVANDIICQKINSNNPSFITRFGSSELATILFYRNERLHNGNKQNWNEHHRHILCEVSGFFPFTPEAMDQFSELYLKLIPNIDMLGVWNVGEQEVKDLYSPSIQLMNLRAIEPYYVPNPWSSALSGKKVLVIHPFIDSIIHQHERRELLFPRTNILPEFNLQIIKAVQSVAGNTQGFNNWFEALESMMDEISKKDFDVAIIGAGAYGMPLANFVKMKMGKVAIHMAGATQILFGIKGKRWENHEFISQLFNEYWIYPSINEIPDNYKKVEGGSYW